MLATAAGCRAGFHVATSYHQQPKPLVRCPGSKRCSSNTAEKAAYMPSSLLPQNSCDTFNFPDDFPKHPPALQPGPHLLCRSRLEATSDFSFRRRRICIRQLLFIKVWGENSKLPLRPQTSMQVQAQRVQIRLSSFCCFQLMLPGYLLAYSPQSCCRASDHRKPAPTDLPYFSPILPGTILQSDPAVAAGDHSGLLPTVGKAIVFASLCVLLCYFPTLTQLHS